MADVITKTRTDYFVSSDPAALHALVKSLKTDGRPAIMARADGKCMFYCDGEIEGVLTPEAMENARRDPDWIDDHPDEAYSFGLFLQTLQALVAPDSACVIKTIGYENMRSLWADAYIVTRTDIRKIDLDGKIQQTVKQIVGGDNAPRMTMREIKPENDRCSCHVCGKKNHGNGAMRVFEIRFDRHAIRICSSCCIKLQNLLAEKLKI